MGFSFTCALCFQGLEHALSWLLRYLVDLTQNAAFISIV